MTATTWPVLGHTMGTPEHTPAEALHLFAEAGLDGAEVVWQDGYRSGIPEQESDGVVAELLRASKDTGLPVLGLAPYMSGINSLDDAEREHDLARFRACLADAARLGARVIRVYAGTYHPQDAGRHAALWQRLVESLRTLAPLAQQDGIVLAVENHFSTMTMTAAESAALAHEVDHPAVGILYDQANLTFTHSEPWEQAVPLQSGHIVHVHAKDLVFVDRDRPFVAAEVAKVKPEERAVRSRALGDGEMDWPGVVGALLAEGYSGPVTLEYEYRWHPQDLPPPAEGYRRGADHLRALLAAAVGAESQGGAR